MSVNVLVTSHASILLEIHKTEHIAWGNANLDVIIDSLYSLIS